MLNKTNKLNFLNKLNFKGDALKHNKTLKMIGGICKKNRYPLVGVAMVSIMALGILPVVEKKIEERLSGVLAQQAAYIETINNLERELSNTKFEITGVYMPLETR